MDNLKFELDKSGVRELLRSQAMMDICQGYADTALGRLGDGYSSSKHVGKNRVNVEVSAKTYKARKENINNNTILKAVMG